MIPASCQYGPGQVSFGVDIPLNSSYDATTIWTEIRLTDPSSPALSIACIEVQSTPFYPSQWYWGLILWLPIALVISFFVLVSVASIATAITSRRKAFKNRAREGGAPRFVSDKLGPALVSALSGKGLVMSPSLLRFATPGCWDVIFHLQFIVAVAMFQVQWPDFAYDFFRQAAWSSLLGNVTLVQSDGEKYDLLSTVAKLPSGDIGEQMSTPTSPLYMNAAQPNVLVNLNNSHTGIEAFASSVGLYAPDLYGTCLAIWLIIVAIIVAISVVAWIIDSSFQRFYEVRRRREEGGEIRLPSSPGIADHFGNGEKNFDRPHSTSSTGRRHHFFFGVSISRNTLGLHGKALHGNLIRALVLFHLPITILSTYQFSQPSSHSTVSIALAALSFAFFSLIAPLWLVWRIYRLPTDKLYEHVGTLLALGPMYHTYAPGSQLYCIIVLSRSLVLGIVTGAGQASGAAQAIIILLVEILVTLASSLWLPWGEGAMMGPINFIACVLRIVTCVLALLLTTLVGFGHEADGWLTYVILLVQGIYFATIALVLLVKIVEALVRLCWRVRFDEKTSGRTAGLGGAIRKIKKRKQKTLQLSRPAAGAPMARGLHPRPNSSGGASSRSGTPVMTNGSKIPMTHSRQASFASYLDQAALPRSQPSTLPRRPNSSGGKDFFGEGVYSAYLRGDANDEGNIMAAMPPTSPGPGPYRQLDSRSSPSSVNPSAPPTPSHSGFVRLGGGRATDADPYASLPPAQRPSMPGAQSGAPGSSASPRRPRPTSQSGVIGVWDKDATVRHGPPPADKRSSYHALQPQSPNEMSSTQAAAAAAAAANARKDTMPPGGARRGGLFGIRRSHNAVEDDGDSSDDSSDNETTWDHRASARGKGAWAGVARMSEALGVLRQRLGGQAPTPRRSALRNRADDDDDDEAITAAGGSLPPGATRGFEVVRAPATRMGGAAQTASQSPTDGTPVHNDDRATEADSTILSHHHVHTHNIGGRGPFGMLGADLQRAPSSAGHSDDGGEERFWLPPPTQIDSALGLDVSQRSGGEGVVHREG